MDVIIIHAFVLKKLPNTLTKGRYRDIVECEVRTYWKIRGIKISHISTVLHRTGIKAALYIKRKR